MGENRNKRSVGAAYEKLAGDYLLQRGYRILEYNFRCRLGEIDIVAEEGGYLVFVEVKYRKTAAKGHPLEAVDSRKQRMICKTAAYYCKTHQTGGDVPCRFDVVAVLGSEISMIPNAFEYCYY